MADTYTEPLGDTWKYDPEYHRTAEFLGVDAYDRQDYETANKIALVRDWAGLHGRNTSLEEAFTAINGLRRSMGVQAQGKSLVNELYRQVRLDLDRRRTQPRPQATPTAQAKPKTAAAPKAAAQPKDLIGGTVAQALGDKQVAGKLQQTVASAVQRHIQQSVVQTLKSVLK